MLRKVVLFLLPLAALTAADDSWKNKRAAEWTDEQTKQILNDSPWAAAVITTVKKEEKTRPHSGGGVSIPGIGHRRTQPDPAEDPNLPATSGSDTGPAVHLRWESALPIREAELKAREINAPVVDEGYYGIAVYGIPSHFTKNLKTAPDQLKGQASLKRNSEKSIKPSHVDVIQRDDGLVIVFLFPVKQEITAQDGQVTFDASIGPYQVTQVFHVDQMIYQGKLEL